MSRIFENIIIKTTPSNLNIDEKNERLVILDEKTGEFHYEKNSSIMFNKLIGRTYSYYIVNFNEFNKVEDLFCEISDPKEGMTIKLKISFELSCIKGKAIKAIRFFKKTTNPYSTLERYFSNWTRDFVIDHPNFTDDFFKLEEELRIYIEGQAEREGLRVRIMKLTPISDDIPDFPPQHMTIIHPSKCEIIDDYIIVENKIVLNLFNRRVFSWRNIDNPETWIKEKTNTIIQNELIDKFFEEIIEGFETGGDIKNNITKKLQEEIKGIGYSIQHIISVPSKEIKDFLDGFEFSLNDDNTFATSEAEIKIRLGVSIDVKESEEKTTKGIDKKFIKPRKSIIEEVKKQTRAIINSTIRGVHPEDCYTKFNDVYNLIKKEINNHLSRNFNLDPTNYTIHISLLKTDLIERFNELFSERGTVLIETKAENTFYEVKYRTQVVNDWYVFHKNHIKFYKKAIDEYSSISEYIKNKIELDIQRLGGNRINIIKTKDLDNIIKKLFIDTQAIITEEFGLEIGEPRLKRISNSDLDDGETYAEVYLEKREQIKKELKGALKADDDDLVEELSDKLTNIREKLKKITPSESSFLKLNQKDGFKKIDETDEEE